MGKCVPCEIRLVGENSLARYVYFYEFSMNFNFPLDKQDKLVYTNLISS